MSLVYLEKDKYRSLSRTTLKWGWCIEYSSLILMHIIIFFTTSCSSCSCLFYFHKRLKIKIPSKQHSSLSLFMLHLLCCFFLFLHSNFLHLLWRFLFSSSSLSVPSCSIQTSLKLKKRNLPAGTHALLVKQHAPQALNQGHEWLVFAGLAADSKCSPIEHISINEMLIFALYAQ